MFGFSKKKKETQELEAVETQLAEQQPSKAKKKSWFGRLSDGLKRTRHNLTGGLTTLFRGKKTIDDELLEELETRLLLADVGVDTTQLILDNLTQAISRKQIHDPAALLDALRAQLIDILQPHSVPMTIDHQPFVILMVGVNGAGKTTSIAKLAHHYQQQGQKIILAAGDTFRAAAIDQLQVWGERNQVPVIAQHSGAVSASVIFDAMQAAKARQYDMLIADTAGRLHTQDHLMAELAKIKRVMAKLDESAPHETMLILDASMGQNALNQAVQFHQAIKLDSISLTKLDGTAKGGIIFAIANKLKLPIRFIGVGEQMDDLKPFVAEEFIEALFATEENIND